MTSFDESLKALSPLSLKYTQRVRFHLVAMPHTQVTRAFAVDAFTEKVRRFSTMMHDLGHEVFLYAGEESEARSTEHIVCISEEERLIAVGDSHYINASYDPQSIHWRTFNENAIQAIRDRIEPRDFICLTSGLAHKAIYDAFPNHIAVEYAVGYPGSFAKHRVFESYSWMHSIYSGYQNPGDVNGEFFDDVIPGFLEVDMFPFREHPSDYFLYIGRVTERKGVRIASEVCERLGKRLIIAGPGNPPPYGEYVGSVDTSERAELMGGAIAVFAPTLYIEPFGYVVIESQMCGTPTITTDWGAFVETNVIGKTGYRCRSFKEFLEAASTVATLDRRSIREHALANYSIDAIGPRYEEYFSRLGTLWDKGWYSE
jgi:glycosyltransferase involved in cell wall biosynthesis